MNFQNSTNTNVYLSWLDIENLVKKAAKKIEDRKYDAIIGITNGGIVPASLIAREKRIDDISFIQMYNKEVKYLSLLSFSDKKKYLIVDDIYDTGNTATIISKILRDVKIVYDFIFLLSRYKINTNLYKKNKIFVGNFLNHDKWIVFPWE